MTTEHHCPRCGRELTGGSLESLCPSCVAEELLGEDEVRDQRSEVTPHAATVTGEAVAAGGAHSLALRADGAVVAWGLSENGQSTQRL